MVVSESRVTTQAVVVSAFLEHCVRQSWTCRTGNFGTPSPGHAEPSSWTCQRAILEHLHQDMPNGQFWNTLTRTCRTSNFWTFCVSPALKLDMPAGNFGTPSPGHAEPSSWTCQWAILEHPHQDMPNGQFWNTLTRTGRTGNFWTFCVSPTLKFDMPTGHFGTPSPGHAERAFLEPPSVSMSIVGGHINIK